MHVILYRGVVLDNFAAVGPTRMVIADLPMGTMLGKYRITGRLGKGGMGVVYAAYDTLLRRPVALKVLGAKVAGQEEFLGRFLLEARAAARLNHRNVVTIHDVSQHDGEHFIVMELVSGGSAQAHLAAQGPYSWSEATRIIADVCRGLGAAHAAGLIHRDVKPANILLSSDGAAKLADFGMTKAPTLAPGGFTQPGTVIGTPQYMSPEHCAGERLDERTDLYSLGATYYALLIGQPPYDGRDPGLILYSHCSAPVPDLRQVAPSLPEGCARIIARAMAKSRTDRYSSADDMLRDLLTLVSSGSTATPPSPSVPADPPTGPTLPVKASPAKPALPLRGLVVALGALAVVMMGGCLIVSGLYFLTRSNPLARVEKPASKEQPRVEKPATPLALQPRPAALDGHRGKAIRAVVSAGGRLISGDTDGTILAWSLDGQLLHSMHHSGELSALAVTLDGKLIAAAGPKSLVSLWDGETGKRCGVLTGIKGNVHALAFAPTGHQLAVASDYELQLHDFEPPAQFTTRTTVLKPDAQYLVPLAAYARDGKRLAACDGAGWLNLWNLPARAPVKSPTKQDGLLTALVLTDDGRRIFLGTHTGIVHVWEPDAGTPPRVFTDKGVCIKALAIAPRHDTLVFAGEWAGPLRLCDLATQKTTLIPTGVQTVHGLCFTPDGKTLAAACSDGKVRLWDVISAP